MHAPSGCNRVRGLHQFYDLLVMTKHLRRLTKLLIVSLAISVLVTAGTIYGNETVGDLFREVSFVGYVLMSWIDTRFPLPGWWGVLVDLLINAFFYAVVLSVAYFGIAALFRRSRPSS